MRTRDRLSSLACANSVAQNIFSRNTIEYHKKRLFLIARFWLKFTLFLCDLLLEKDDDLVVLKIYFFKFFCRKRAKCDKKSLSFFCLFFVLCLY